MKKLFSFGIVFVLFVFALSFNVSAADWIGAVADLNGYLTDEENRSVSLYAQEAAQKTKMNIIIYVCDDVGYNKSDRAVVDHADVMYENLCGINTDGILLLINLDTKYDYISTSGVAINYFSDKRIDKMFDWFWDDLVDENYAEAAYGFIDSVVYYYGQGKANNQSQTADYSVTAEEFFTVFLGSMFFAIIVGVIIYNANLSRFKMKKPVTVGYVVNNSLQLNQCTDTYIGTVVNRVYSPRDTGGGSGGSSHSSTHHSSGGGTHGGGGRHR